MGANATQTAAVDQSGRVTPRLQLRDVQSLISHLDSEEAAMRAFSKVIQDMPQMIVSPESQRVFRQRLDQAATVSETLAERRAAILMHIGYRSGLSIGEVNLSNLVAVSDTETATALVTCQRRLRRVLTQLQHLGAVVSWIMNETHVINAVLLNEVLGDQATSRYTANGVRSMPS
ncbi:MAG: hypothetical protein KC496_22915, partial [Anaerolineae bacterium]|nr:hypothetical protein [Anaerolineae bacterium]